jgi:protein-S-isoprenylcysteine O-methyltransferase Ste14
MEFKGWKKFREKTPVLSGYRILALPAYVLLVLVAALSALIWFDSLPETHASSPLAFLAPLLGVLVVGPFGFLMVFQMWLWRDRLKARYGALSYQRIFLVGVTGVICVLSLAINVFIPFWSFAPSFWAGSLLGSPLDSHAGALAAAVFWARMALALLLSATGVAMMIRSLLTFGFDYMTVVYLYFPEESRIQENRIYSVLRHPMYAGGLTLALGGMFFTFTPYSLVFFLLFLCGFYAHVHFVEEKELILRFGAPYGKYMKDVPAFFIRPKDAGALLDYLLGRV